MAHPEVRVIVSKGVRPGLAAAYAVMILAAFLVLTAGVAAGSGVDVGSFAQDVMDKLVEPLPISAETLEGSGALGPGPQAAGNEAGGSGQTVGQGAAAQVGPADSGGEVSTDQPAQDDPLSPTIPSEGIGWSAPTGSEYSPAAGDPLPRDKHGDSDHITLEEDGPPGQDGGSSHGRGGPDTGGNSGCSRDDGNQSGEDRPVGGGPRHSGSNGSNGSNDPNEGTGGPPHDAGNGGLHNDESCGTNQSSGGRGGSR